MATKKPSKAVRRVGLSERNKKIVLVASGCVLLVAGSWWAYMTFTTAEPPPLGTASPNEVVKFLGDPRGYPRMGMEDRERYLAEFYQKHGQENREELIAALNSMSAREKQVFVDTTFEAFKVRFLESASEYNRLPKTKRAQFVDSIIQNFQASRQSMAGGSSAENLGAPFRDMVPNTSDGLSKVIVTKTKAHERAKAQPLFDATAARMKELQDAKSR